MRQALRLTWSVPVQSCSRSPAVMAGCSSAAFAEGAPDSIIERVNMAEAVRETAGGTANGTANASTNGTANRVDDLIDDSLLLERPPAVEIGLALCLDYRITHKRVTASARGIGWGIR